MKKLLICLLMAVGLFANNVAAVEAPAAFRQAFAEHLKKGTLFDYRTARDFSEKGWGQLYQDAVASDFKGASADGLRLAVGSVKGDVLQTGDKVALIFRLFNDSEQDATVLVGGSCHTVHAATFMVLDSQGALHQNLGMGKVGGPHCFCQQTKTVLRHGTAIWLDTNTDSEGVINWIPDKPGKFVIIGVYWRGTKEEPERKILSKPLILDIRKKNQ